MQGSQPILVEYDLTIPLSSTAVGSIPLRHRMMEEHDQAIGGFGDRLVPSVSQQALASTKTAVDKPAIPSEE